MGNKNTQLTRHVPYPQSCCLEDSSGFLSLLETYFDLFLNCGAFLPNALPDMDSVYPYIHRMVLQHHG